MEKNKYEIKYLPRFITEFNNILYYLTYELDNKIVAEQFYNEVIRKIEKRSEAPTSFEVFRTLRNSKINWYKINVKKYTIFYVVKDNTMEVRRILHSKRNLEKYI